MPTILRWQNFRFYFFSNEGFEPPHIHVDKESCSAKFWLSPISLARNYGFAEHEIRVLLRKVIEEEARFLEAWHVYFSN